MRIIQLLILLFVADNYIYMHEAAAGDVYCLLALTVVAGVAWDCVQNIIHGEITDA